MSDHGYTHDLAHGSVADRFGNVFAAFTPGAPELFAPGAINILPILFNRYLGTDISQSRDRFFISPNAFNSPLIMTEVASDSHGDAGQGPG